MKNNLQKLLYMLAILFLSSNLLVFGLSCKRKDEQTNHSERVDKAEEALEMTKSPEIAPDIVTAPEQVVSPSPLTTPLSKMDDKVNESDSKTKENKPLAKVNGTIIYEKDLKGRNLDDVITDEILYQAALKQGVDKKIEEKVDRYEKNLIIRSMKQEILRNQVKAKDESITEEEIEDYYKNNRERFSFFTVQSIAVDDRITAEDIRNRAIKGENLENIKSQIEKTGEKLSIIKFTLPNNLKRLFDSYDVGNVSNIYERFNHFVVLKIIDVKRIPLSEVKMGIQQAIIASRKKDPIRKNVEKLKNENDIVVEILNAK